MCRAPLPGQKVEGQGHTCGLKFSFVRSVAIWLFDRFTSYGAQIQPTPFRGQKVKVRYVAHIYIVGD